METSWQEKRDDLDAGISSLPAAPRTTTEQRLDSLRVAASSPVGMRPHAVREFSKLLVFRIAFDPQMLSEARDGYVTRMGTVRLN
jgi:hypothetical protein